mmetsp:Transcript_1158/g.1646  ORF Transcript_1158/g.1646 Transcript_1158/m.1646 type:complete len:109 (+) Transcript_1158:57-383(+)
MYNLFFWFQYQAAYTISETLGVRSCLLAQTTRFHPELLRLIEEILSNQPQDPCRPITAHSPSCVSCAAAKDTDALFAMVPRRILFCFSSQSVMFISSTSWSLSLSQSA